MDWLSRPLVSSPTLNDNVIKLTTRAVKIADGRHIVGFVYVHVRDMRGV